MNNNLVEKHRVCCELQAALKICKSKCELKLYLLQAEETVDREILEVRQRIQNLKLRLAQLSDTPPPTPQQSDSEDD